MDKINDYEYDFAISYAGEDLNIAKRIKQSITEISGDYSIFLASDEQSTLVGKDGEKFFQDLFQNSKQVIVLFSENYKRKEWPRFEFDIIRKRDENNRFIPIKLDNVNILGLPSTVFFIPFSNNYDSIADIAVQKLIAFEKNNHIPRETEFQKKRRELKNSRGSIDKAYQLILDNRERTPLENIDYPEGDFQKSYSIIDLKDSSYSKISRIRARINLPANLSEEAVKYNLKHCNADIFNKYKPEALSILAYSDQASNFLGFYDKFNVASCDFAFYGDLARAEEGFAYNMPVNKFEYKIQLEKSYFDANLKIMSGSEIAENLIMEILDEKIIEIIRNSQSTNTSDILKINEKIKPDIIRKRLKILKKEKRIKRIGSKYNWHWEMVEK